MVKLILQKMTAIKRQFVIQFPRAGGMPCMLNRAIQESTRVSQEEGARERMGDSLCCDFERKAKQGGISRPSIGQLE